MHDPHARTARRQGPFELHLREAIALNRERAPLYADLSGGATWTLSRLLIAAECLLLPVARWFDRAAAPYHRMGVPLLDELFVPMAHAPAFGSVRLPADTGHAALRLRPAVIRRSVQRAYGEGGFAHAASALASELAALEAAPNRHHMVRHLLESAYRLACLAPAQVAHSHERGLPSPEPLLARLLHLHLWGLASAAGLDRRAAPLLARGIPILAQDLPPITAEPRRCEGIDSGSWSSAS